MINVFFAEDEIAKNISESLLEKIKKVLNKTSNLYNIFFAKKSIFRTSTMLIRVNYYQGKFDITD